MSKAYDNMTNDNMTYRKHSYNAQSDILTHTPSILARGVFLIFRTGKSTEKRRTDFDKNPKNRPTSARAPMVTGSIPTQHRLINWSYTGATLELYWNYTGALTASFRLSAETRQQGTTPRPPPRAGKGGGGWTLTAV